MSFANDLWRRGVCATTTVALTACAAPYKPYTVYPTSEDALSDSRVCMAVWSGVPPEGGFNAYQIYSARGLSEERCKPLRDEERRRLADAAAVAQPEPAESVWPKIAAGVLAFAGGVLLGKALFKSGGGGASAAPQGGVTMDITWAWDEFFDDQYRLVWACRGEQTGQFAPVERCQYAPKIDLKWPDKMAPWRR